MFRKNIESIEMTTQMVEDYGISVLNAFRFSATRKARIDDESELEFVPSVLGDVYANSEFSDCRSHLREVFWKVSDANPTFNNDQIIRESSADVFEYINASLQAIASSLSLENVFAGDFGSRKPSDMQQRAINFFYEDFCWYLSFAATLATEDAQDISSPMLTSEELSRRALQKRDGQFAEFERT